MAERTIRIRNKKTGQTKQVTVDEAKSLGVKLNPLQSFVTSKSAPLWGSALTGTIAGLGTGGLGAIGGAAVGGGTTAMLQNLLAPFAGVSNAPVGWSGQVAPALGEAGKGALSEAAGQGVAAIGNKIASPLIRSLPWSKTGAIKGIDKLMKETGDQINDLLGKYENKNLSKKTMTKIMDDLDKLGQSPTFKYNETATSFIEDVKNTLSGELKVGPAHAKSVDFGGAVFTKAGAEKYAGRVPQKALQASEEIVAPQLKAGIEEIAPGYMSLNKRYGDLAKMKSGFGQKIQTGPATTASILGGSAGAGIGALTVGGLPGAFAGAGVASLGTASPALIAANPYLTYLARKVGGNLVNPTIAGYGVGRLAPYGLVGGYNALMGY